MTSSAHTQLVMGALASAAQVAMNRHSQQHEQSLLQLRFGAVSDLVDALVTRRIDTVTQGCRQVLDQYAEQARHFMAQQTKYADAVLTATDPMTRVELNQRIRDVDIELGRIRAEAALIYAQMNEVILLIGGTNLNFGDDQMSALALPMARGWA